ncbi:MAG: JDVT-CTERM system CAAX-type protease [Gammaproteobacteria bacterium]|nr:JDVT-CTERM system CAAX-type protease [Gammaproteobacteria bacterium]
MKQHGGKTESRFVPVVSGDCFRDYRFWVALAFGPLVWLLLATVVDLPITNAQGFTAVSLLSLILLYPVLEELVFRGGVQGWFHSFAVARRSWLGISLSNLATSLIFAALHFISQPPVWAALVFFPSLVFGWARDRYQALTGSICLHVLYNAGVILLFG